MSVILVCNVNLLKETKPIQAVELPEVKLETQKIENEINSLTLQPASSKYSNHNNQV